MKSATLHSLAVILLLGLIVLLPVQAQNVPLAISYQAVLTNETGGLLSPEAPTNYMVEFGIWTSIEGGDLRWAESQTVSVYQGSFSTLLGIGDAVPEKPRPELDTVFDGAERFLEITVFDPGAKTFSPRQQMVSAPFAFRSKVSERALTVAAGAVANDQLTAGAVTLVKLADDSVDSTKIKARSVGNSDLAPGAVNGDILSAGAVNVDKLAAAVVNRLVPAGSVIAWAGVPGSGVVVRGFTFGDFPSGWILCDGGAHSTAAYPELFKAIGYIYGGSGDTFHVPDYRGYFLRGVFGVDPDPGSREWASPWAEGILREGSIQQDEFKAHNHGSGIYDKLLRVSPGTERETAGSLDRTAGEVAIGPFDFGAIQSRGGSETRPKNRYVWYIIKAH